MKKSKSVLFLLGAVFAALLGSTSVSVAEGPFVTSLRGDLGIASDAQIPAKRRIYKDVDPFYRTWKEQPPSMPHKDYSITIKENRCMECHGDESYREEEATKVGDSHYLHHNGRKTHRLAGARFFCNQCHTPLYKVEPLIDNEIKTSTRR
jgi:cytochrome c-type protein NapB